MKKFLRVISILYLLMILLPQFSYAQIVPCSGSDCTICHLGILANNIINWLVNFSFAAATLMIIYGGYLIMTAGLSPKQYEEGKGIIFAAIMGVAIILTSWIVINTAIQYLTGLETWYRIECK